MSKLRKKNIITIIIHIIGINNIFVNTLFYIYNNDLFFNLFIQ